MNKELLKKENELIELEDNIEKALCMSEVFVDNFNLEDGIGGEGGAIAFALDKEDMCICMRIIMDYLLVAKKMVCKMQEEL